jgi:hypothetical protein
VLGDVLEGEKKSLEVVVEIELVDFSAGDAVAATLAEFEERGGVDCALEMQVKLGLGKLAEEAARQSVEGGGHYLLIVDSWGEICEEELEHHGDTEARRKAGGSARVSLKGLESSGL